MTRWLFKACQGPLAAQTDAIGIHLCSFILMHAQPLTAKLGHALGPPPRQSPTFALFARGLPALEVPGAWT